MELSEYLKQVNEHNLLSTQEEINLAKTIHKYKVGQKRQEAREKLVNCNQKMVVKLASKYQNLVNHDIMDLINTGLIGLAYAVDNFNPRKFKTRFSTYAWPIVESKIINYIYDFNSTVRMSSQMFKLTKKCSDMIYQNHDVTDDDIMKSLHVSKEGLRKVKLASNKCISIDQRLSDTNSDWNDDKKTTLQDILVDHKNKSSHEMAIKDEEKKIIRSAIDTLEEKDKKIIVQLFFGNKTLGQVGKGLNISAEAVRQRKRNALRQLRFRIAKKIKMTRRGIYA